MVVGNSNIKSVALSFMIFGLFMALFMFIYTSSITNSEFDVSNQINQTRLDSLNNRLNNISVDVTGTALGSDPSIAPGSAASSDAFSKGIAAILAFANGLGVVNEGIGIAMDIGIGVPGIVWIFILIMILITVVFLIAEFMWRYKS